VKETEVEMWKRIRASILAREDFDGDFNKRGLEESREGGRSNSISYRNDLGNAGEMIGILLFLMGIAPGYASALTDTLSKGISPTLDSYRYSGSAPEGVH
jgi:hypothetical protein